MVARFCISFVNFDGGLIFNRKLVSLGHSYMPRIEEGALHLLLLRMWEFLCFWTSFMVSFLAGEVFITCKWRIYSLFHSAWLEF